VQDFLWHMCSACLISFGQREALITVDMDLRADQGRKSICCLLVHLGFRPTAKPWQALCTNHLPGILWSCAVDRRLMQEIVEKRVVIKIGC
jgi:hypothetical protein